MQLSTVVADDVPAAVGPYSQAVVAGGLLFVSGQLPLAPGSGAIVEGTIAEQTRQALENAIAVVRQAGLGIPNVAKVTVFLTDLRAYGEVNEIYGSFFEGWRPARSVVEVSGLPRGALVEIELVAAFAAGGKGESEA